MDVEAPLSLRQARDRHLEGHASFAFGYNHRSDLITNATVGDAVDVNGDLLSECHASRNQ